MTGSKLPDQQRFASLAQAKRLWVVGAIHGDVSRLFALHDQIADQVRYGDRLVYTGNMLGRGSSILACLDELLTFRRWFLSMPPYMDQTDVVYLRGQQEEMFQKLQQLQFAKEPAPALDWMRARGVDATVQAYGADLGEAEKRLGEGVLAITHWTAAFTEAVHAHPGHDLLLNSLYHAAYTHQGGPLLAACLAPDGTVLDMLKV